MQRISSPHAYRRPIEPVSPRSIQKVKSFDNREVIRGWRYRNSTDEKPHVDGAADAAGLFGCQQARAAANEPAVRIPCEVLKCARISLRPTTAGAIGPPRVMPS